MTQSEAYSVAKSALFNTYELEPVVVDGKSRMVPKERATSGAAKRSEDQRAADAWNWFEDQKMHMGGHR